MVRKLTVVVPEKHSSEILDVLTMNRSVHHLSYHKNTIIDDHHSDTTHESVTFTFSVVNKKTHELIDLLTLYGVSSRFGTLDVTALTSTKPRVATTKDYVGQGDPLGYQSSANSSGQLKKKKRFAVTDRLAYDEVYDTIDGQLHLTFDYLALIATGAIIAAIGLLTDSAVVVVASMLVSPLMGPIVGMTFGAIIKDRTMLWKSFRNEVVGIIVCFCTGALMGFVTAPLLDEPESDQLAFGANTQISSRGEWIALAWGAGIAAPSGVGVALGVSSDQVAALIGVAISAALLPPITNAGVCLSSALVYEIDPRYSDQIVAKWFKVGYISFLLFFLNWLLIFVFGIATFRIKNLHHSANEQVKMARLNKFYQMRDKLEADGELDVKGKKKKKAKKSSASTTLKTPLLVGVAEAVKYSDREDGFNVRMGVNNGDSMDGLSSGHSMVSDKGDVLGDLTASSMSSWDKVQGRGNRGFSEVVTATPSKSAKAKDEMMGLSKKRKVKRSSFDASASKAKASFNTKTDDMV